MEDVFLVTGASKGLGRSIALAIANSGATVVAMARNSSELNEIEAELKTISGNSIAVSCDLSNSADISNASDFILSKFDHLSGIVHNAGIINPIGNMLDISRDDWELTLKVNLLGVQDLTRSLEGAIGGEKHTRVTTISSGAAQRSLHGWSAYCVSKAGLDMWTNCMAEEGKNENISALAIAPGIVDTAMQEDIRSADESSFPLLQNFKDYYVNGELSKPDDVASKLLPYCLGELGNNGDRLDVRNL
jgi:benzil reductase ((S)-benzoin forming)